MAGVTQELGQLLWKLTGDDSDIKKKIGNTEKEAKGLGSKLNKAFSVFKFALVAAGVTKITKELIGAASEAEEVKNKFDVTFKGLETGSAAAAKNLANNYGVSVTASRRLLAASGDLLNGFGFTKQASLELAAEVNKLGIDLASFQNLPTERAVNAINAAMVGNTESMRSLGVVIRQDTKEFRDNVVAMQESRGVSLQQAKSLEILRQVTLQSKNAVGDFQRSQHSFANQMKIATANIQNQKDELGNKLLPTATKALNIFNKLTGTEDDLETVTTDLVSANLEYNEILKKLNGETGTLIGNERSLSIIRKFELEELQAKGLEKLVKRYGELNSKVSIFGTTNKDDIRNRSLLINQLEEQADETNFIQSQIDKEIESRGKTGELSREEIRSLKERGLLSRELSERSITLGFAIGKVNEQVIIQSKEITSQKKLKAELDEENTKLVESALLLINASEKYSRFIKAENEELYNEAVAYGVVLEAKKKEEAGKKSAADAEIARLAEIERLKKAAEDAEIARVAKAEKDQEALIARLERLSTKLGEINAIVSAGGEIAAAITQQRLNDIDRELQAELEAAGVADETSLETAENELEAAEKTGNAILIKEAEDAVTKAEIEEKYQQKKAQLEYEGQLWAYGTNVINAGLQGAMATLNAFTSTLAIPTFGPALAPGAATAAGIASAAMVAAAIINKPEKPSFAVGTARVQRDTVANVHKDEIILPKGIADTARNEGISIAPTGNGSGMMLGLTIIAEGRTAHYEQMKIDGENHVLTLPSTMIVEG